MKTHLVALLFVLGVCCPALARGQSSPPATQVTSNASESEPPKPYHLVKTIPLPFLKKMSGQLGFDEAGDRLFFSDGKDLVVINARSGERVGLIPKIGNVSDVAFAPDIHRAFIVDSYSHELFVLDLSNLALVQKTNVGTESSSLVYDQGVKEVFTTDSETSTCKVFDAVAGKKVAAVKLQGYPVHAAYDAHGHIYFEVASNDSRIPPASIPGTYIAPMKTDLAELDSRTLLMGDRWKEAPCPHMRLMGVDRSGQDLVIGCQNSVMLVDPQSRKTIASSTIMGVRPIAPLTVSPSLGDAFFAGLDEQADPHRLVWVIVHEDSSGHLGPAVLAPQVLGRPAAFDGTTQQFFAVQSDMKIGDSGLYMTVPGSGPTPVPVQQPVPGTFRILVYGRD